MNRIFFLSLLDLSTAFDTIDQDILLQSLCLLVSLALLAMSSSSNNNKCFYLLDPVCGWTYVVERSICCQNYSFSDELCTL